MSAEPLHKTLWQENQALAEECLTHPFVRGLGDGSLDPEVFKHYVAQDAFFLQAFFSAYALGAVRAAERRQVVQRLHGLMGGVLNELKPPRRLCRESGNRSGERPTPSSHPRLYRFLTSDSVDDRSR